ncbi:PH domain-containing protein [Actinoplanes sp. NPDC026670]|uniref:PH domain-containing protein n=1 Tax=Actinoplanes sp. NPDC026670 TaxID=3154700 RepID=UPI00340FD104
MQWRVKPALPVAKLIAASALPLLVAVFGPEDLSRWLVAAVVATAIVAWAARDVLHPVRLSADDAGITVLTGFARRRHISWDQIEAVRVERARRSDVLEIDTGEAVYVLGEPQLSADPHEVAVTLADLRPVS